MNSKRVFKTSSSSFRFASKNPNNYRCNKEEEGSHAISTVEEESLQSGDNGRFFFDNDKSTSMYTLLAKLYTNNSCFRSKSPTLVIVLLGH